MRIYFYRPPIVEPRSGFLPRRFGTLFTNFLSTTASRNLDSVSPLSKHPDTRLGYRGLIQNSSLIELHD